MRERRRSTGELQGRRGDDLAVLLLVRPISSWWGGRRGEVQQDSEDRRKWWPVIHFCSENKSESHAGYVLVSWDLTGRVERRTDRSRTTLRMFNERKQAKSQCSYLDVCSWCTLVCMCALRRVWVWQTSRTGPVHPSAIHPPLLPSFCHQPVWCCSSW